MKDNGREDEERIVEKERNNGSDIGENVMIGDQRRKDQGDSKDKKGSYNKSNIF